MHKRASSFSLVAITGLSFALLLPFNASATVSHLIDTERLPNEVPHMPTSGAGSAEFTGQETLNLPIKLPKGTAGFTPNIALSYESGGADRGFGVGWSLPLSRITRSLRYGVYRAVEWTNADAVYEYDGRTLYSAGTTETDPYGCTATRYYSNPDTFQRILFCDSGGLDYWTVTGKDGTYTTYGKLASLGSRVVDADPSLPAYPTMQYLEESVTDTHGLSWTITYDQSTYYDSSSGRYLPRVPVPVTIDYTYQSGSPVGDLRQVQITWDSQVLGTTDRLGFTQAAGRHAMSIEVDGSGTRVRKYYLGYAIDQTTNHYVLSTFEEDGLTDSDTMPVTSFTYGALHDSAHSTYLAFANTPYDVTLPVPYHLDRSNLDQNGNQWVAVADLNGDGYPDLIDATCVDPGNADCTHTQQDWYVYWGLGTGGFAPTAVPFYGIQTPIRYDEINGTSSRSKIMLIDMNGDGLPDVLDTTSVPAVVYINMGSYFQPVQWNTSINLSAAGTVLQDLDGDHCPDLLTYYNDGTIYPKPQWQHNELCDPNPQAAFDSSPQPWTQPSSVQDVYTQPTPGQFIDINGDGREDEILDGKVLLGTGRGVEAETGATTFGADLQAISGTAPKMNQTANDGSGNYAALVDVTGDGLPDWVVTTEQSGSTQTVGSCYATTLSAYNAWEACVAQFGLSNCGTEPNFCACTQYEGNESPTWQIYVNTGHGFNRSPITWNAARTLAVFGWVSGEQYLSSHGESCSPSLASVEYGDFKLLDLTGDGLVDAVRQVAGNTTTLEVYPNEAAPDHELLVSIDNGIGGQEDISYLPETSASPTTIGSYADSSYFDPFTVPDPARPAAVSPSTNDWSIPANQAPTLLAWNAYDTIDLTGANLGVPELAVVRKRDYDALQMTDDDSGYPVGRFTITDYGYHHPYYDPVRREFRGYRQVETLIYDDVSNAAHYSSRTFDVGADPAHLDDPLYDPYGAFEADYPALAGRQVEVQEGPYRQSLLLEKWTEWTGRWVAGLPSQQPSGLPTVVDQPLVIRALTGDLSSSPAFWTAKTFQYDTPELGASNPPMLGNLTDEVDFGHVPVPTSGSFPVLQDPQWSESFYRYATPATGGPWLVGLPCMSETEFPNCDGTSCAVSTGKQVDTYYTGTLCGAGSTGDPTAEEVLIRYPGDVDRWRTTYYAYDSFGNVEEETDPLGATTSTTYYDSSTQSTSVEAYPWETDVYNPTSGLTFTTKQVWDEGRGLLQSETTPTGRTVTDSYDNMGRPTLVTSTQPSGTGTSSVPIVSYAYELAGDSTTTSQNSISMDVFSGNQAGDPDELTQTYYDGFGQPVETMKVRNGSQVTAVASVFGYNGKVVLSTLPYTSSSMAYAVVQPALWTVSPQYATSWRLRDWRGRMGFTAIQDASASSIFDRYSYNYTGNTVLQSGPRNYMTQRVYDGRGNLVAVTQDFGSSSPETTTYGYDGANRLRSIHDPLGDAWTYDYDSQDELRNSSDPDRGSSSFTYDIAGNMSSSTDARDDTTNYYRDDLGRVTEKTYNCGGASCGTSAYYGYDCSSNAYGKLCYHYLSDYTAETYRYFDTWGRENAYWKMVNGNWNYFTKTLDYQGRRLSLGYPNGDSAVYTREDDGSVVGIQYGPTSALQSVVSNVTYDAFGRARTIDWGNGETTYNYVGANEKISAIELDAPSPNGAELNLAYTYDSAGNPLTVSDSTNGWSRTYSYDWDNRLVEAKHYDGGTLTKDWTWSFDAANRMTTSSGATYNYSGAGPHQISSVTGSGTLAFNPFAYNADGEVTTNGGTGATFTYDQAGRVATATNPATGSSDSFAYDADGSRIWKNSSYGSTSSWVQYFGPEEELSYDGSLNHTDLYVMWAGKRVVKIRDGTLYYMHPDVQGSVSVYSSDAGIPLERRIYTPYGAVYSDGTPTLPYTPRYGYVGSEEDFRLGLLHLGPREQAPALGLMLQPDPLGPEGRSPKELNPYNYADFNPIFYMDPSGYDGSGLYYDLGYANGVVDALSPILGAISAKIQSKEQPRSAKGIADGLGNTGKVMAGVGSSGEVDGGGEALAGSEGVVTALPGVTVAGVGAVVAATGALDVATAAYLHHQLGDDGGSQGTLPKPGTGRGTVPPDQRDPKRRWTPKERAEQRAEQGNKCANGCGEDIDGSNSRGHHKVRHADGGKTDKANHAEVCKTCHNKLHSGTE